MSNEVHIKVKTRLSSDGTGSNILISKFHQACEQLDASIFEPFIREDDIFEDVGKYEFLHNLKELFDAARHDLRLESLSRQQGHCTFCHPGADVAEYLDPATGEVLFAYYFEVVEGQLTDVYRCEASDGVCGEEAPF